MMMMMMKNSGLSGPFLLLLLLLLCSAASGLGSVVSKPYGHLRSHHTWQSAQSFCRSSDYYTDLATVYTQSDADGLDLRLYFAWIGLHRGTGLVSRNWYWSDGTYENWSNGANYEPNYMEDCALVHYSNRRFYGNDCGAYFFFFCQKEKANEYEYTFIPQSKTWSEAEHYCREAYDGLAVFKTYSDLQSAVDPWDFPVWTGLRRDGETWKWSRGLSEYRNWAANEPGDSGDCVSISSLSKKMAVQDCNTHLPFICYGDNLVLVKQNKTWEEALDHCRALNSTYNPSLKYELVSVQPGADHNFTITKVMEADTEEVWTGLRFMAGQWLWVNGADMLYSDLPACPPVEQRCGALFKNDTGSVETTDCLERRNFICYSQLT